MEVSSGVKVERSAFCAPLSLVKHARTSTLYLTSLPLRHGAVPRTSSSTRHARVIIIPPPTTPQACAAAPAGGGVKASPTYIELAAPSKDTLFATQEFSGLGMLPELVQAMGKMGITMPTAIQSRGIPPILSGANVILGAATGSGKTLAYLLPVIQGLKVAEALRKPNDPPLRIARRPRAVVIVPTRELATQVCAIAKKISHIAKFRAVGVDGAGTLSAAKSALVRAPVDILVGTTGRILQLSNAHHIDLRFASHVVIDEVDTMFDAGFAPDLERLLTHMRRPTEKYSPELQVIAAGATHPRAAEALYAKQLPGAVRINAALHRAPPGLRQRFVYVSGRAKLAELDSLLSAATRDGTLKDGNTTTSGGRMIVFCNTIDSTRFVDHYIHERGHSTSCVHGDMPSTRRTEEYVAFKRGESHILVCSDMAARGLDNVRVDHVILFDFPTSAVDYIHRAGRTARAGAKGTVTSLVTKKDERLAKAIQKATHQKSDALESAREAREDELKRKELEATRRRNLARDNAAQIEAIGSKNNNNRDNAFADQEREATTTLAPETGNRRNFAGASARGRGGSGLRGGRGRRGGRGGGYVGSGGGSNNNNRRSGASRGGGRSRGSFARRSGR